MVPDIGNTMDADAYVEGGERALVVRVQEDQLHVADDGSGQTAPLAIPNGWGGDFDKVIFYQVNTDEDENAVYTATFEKMVPEGGEAAVRIAFGPREFKGETRSTWFHFAGVKETNVTAIPAPQV
ncbi:MAG: hypothetical protein R3272_04045 [Candidatus Promineifilaceae bacterium]|nr:hypothetical protein [Candidatus Promineifilaceae bacterium]